jgi:hypothetical protein
MRGRYRENRGAELGSTRLIDIPLSVRHVTIDETVAAVDQLTDTIKRYRESGWRGPRSYETGGNRNE